MLRFNALNNVRNRKPLQVAKNNKRSGSFAIDVLSKVTMRQLMTRDTSDTVISAIRYGTKISRRVANQVATAMRDWATSKETTHYAHWFQPLTGGTAEKHDAFFEPVMRDSTIERFSGNQLAQRESDAPSFPNRDIRSAFEARGYAAWDPSSPPFVYGTVLCIPTTFIACTGEASDNKTSLFKALSAIDQTVTEVVRYFGKDVNEAACTLGREQEYFLIDRALANTRPDLMITGRTLLEHEVAKGQQLDGHYLGAIPNRMLAHVRDLEQECLLLDTPVKTHHNGVAPNQFELAPTFGEANLAVGQNSLLMDMMCKVAERHGSVVLFHEKPFTGVNGSGKYSDWSLVTDTGVNLFIPSKTPQKNLQSLAFFVYTTRAIHECESLLHASVASATNDYRLGANEAPSTIVSVFIGEQLNEVLDALESMSDEEVSGKDKTELKLDMVGEIPNLFLDTTDRNRTSPSAFTGNKFEFRAVGSKANYGKPMMVLNTIVAKQLIDFKKETDNLIEGGMRREDVIFRILRACVKSSKAVHFEDDGYSKAWEKEAARRGLSDHKTTPEALRGNITDKAIALLGEMGVLSKVELITRYEVALEECVKTAQIESRVLDDIAHNHVVPAVMRYQNTLIENVHGLRKIFGDAYQEVASEQINLIRHISKHIKVVYSTVEAMIEARKRTNHLTTFAERADAYYNGIKPLSDEIRYHCDRLELMIGGELRTLTKYRKLLLS